MKLFCEGYARAEVDKIVKGDADNFEYRQELEYNCLLYTSDAADE